MQTNFMLHEKNFANLTNLKNVRDVIIIGRFSNDNDDNDIIIYGFSDPNQSYNKRKLKLKSGDEGIHLVYSVGSNPDIDLIEPVYPVMKNKGDFVVAGNGLQTARTREVINSYKIILNKGNPEIGEILSKALREKYVYEDVNEHELELNSFKPDRYMTPRIQGILYGPYQPKDAEAAFAITKVDGLGNKMGFSIGMDLIPNQAKMIATYYALNSSANMCNPIDLDFGGWVKANGDAHEYQKELTDLVFECLGPNAVGAASMLSHPKHEYIINQIKE